MPGDVRISHTNLYRVRPSQPVALAIAVGDGQVGGTALTLNGAPVQVVGDRASIGQAGQNLVGSVLQCVTTVQDVNRATNRTSVTYSFTGGLAAQDFPFAIQVSGDSGLALYTITFLFTS